MTFTPWASSGSHSLAVAADRPLALQTHHARLARAVDVRIEQADAGAVERQGEREVHGGRRLADAALARRDGDDVADARQRLQLALHRVRLHLPADRDDRVLEPRLARSRPCSVAASVWA